jgi:hypothetical protein
VLSVANSNQDDADADPRPDEPDQPGPPDLTDDEAAAREADEFDRRWEELARVLEAELPSADGADTLLAEAADAPDAPDAPPSDLDKPPDDDGSDDGDEWRLGAAAGPRDWDPGEEAEGHFIPPEPPPVMAGDPLIVASWTALALALLGLAWWEVFHPNFPWWLPRALVIVLAGAVGALIWRMPHKREDPDDTGAQV